MNLSKSKYCEGITCLKKLWLELYKKEEATNINESVLENGTEVGELARNLFGKHINIEYDSNLDNMVKQTKKVLEENDNVVVTEASFNYNNNFCSVDILVKRDDGYIIYEVKSSTEVKDIYIEDISYQYYVLSELGYSVFATCIVTINPSYVREGELDLNKLFIINDATYFVFNNYDRVISNIDYINKNITDKEPNIQLGKYCKKPYDCPYFNYCTKDLEKPNIFDIKDMKFDTKLKLYKEQLISFKELLSTKINPKYKEQVEFELYDKEPKINKEYIKDFLDTISYPIYFLDFETYQEAIPSYDGIKPYMQIPFQYSLHILYEDGTLEHKEFLSESGIDPRRKLAEQLVKDIPLNSCTMAYNMSFEKTRIKELANLFPDLKEHLLNINDNMVDLMIPFYKRNYYTKEMQGSYSIKYVLPALFPNDPELDYHNLPVVHKGDEASAAFINLKNLSKEEQEKVRNGLLVYCGLDTYAMVKIYEKLLEVTNNKHIKK